MESKTKNRKTREQIVAMVGRAFGGLRIANVEDAITELKEGWFNVAYIVRLSDGREAILKIAPPRDVDILAYEKNIMETEVASLRLVHENPAIPVPAVYFFDTTGEICDSAYFFMEKLAGDNYEHVRKSLPPTMQAQIDRQTGAIVREINGFMGTYFGYRGNSDLRGVTWKEAFIKIIDSVLADAARKQADLGYPLEEIREVVLRHARSLEAVTTPQLVHWDAWDLNFFVKDGKVTGIIDFERALWADPLMEALFRMRAFGGVTESMRGYGKTSFTHEEDQRCRLYTLYLALVMKTECYYRNYDTDTVSEMAMQLMMQSVSWLKEN